MQNISTSFKPEVFKHGSAWEQEITNNSKKKVNRLQFSKENNCENLNTHGRHIPNVVKVVDKSYLDKDYRMVGLSELVDSTARVYSLNKAQECTFR